MSPATGEDETFLRRVVFPEEERRQLTSAQWDGSYRWFKSPNVICLEHYRSQAERYRIARMLLLRARNISGVGPAWPST
jgi:hypothetical protein